MGCVLLVSKNATKKKKPWRACKVFPKDPRFLCAPLSAGPIRAAPPSPVHSARRVQYPIYATSKEEGGEVEGANGSSR